MLIIILLIYDYGNELNKYRKMKQNSLFIERANLWHNSKQEQPDGKQYVITWDEKTKKCTVDKYTKVFAPKWCYLDDILE